MRNRRVVNDITAAEDQQSPEITDHPGRLLIGKIPGPPLRPDPPQPLHRIVSAARDIQCAVVHIGGIDLDVIFADALSKMLRQQDSQRISLLAGSASRYPPAKTASGTDIVEQRRQHVVSQ